MFADPAGQSVNAVYHDNSHGQVSFSGSVVGRYTLNALSTDACDISAWASAADAQAAASGVDVGSYAHKIYVMPPVSSCPGVGLSTVGGAPSSAWVFDCSLRDVYEHEVGHNLGMDHASVPGSEYGDGGAIGNECHRVTHLPCEDGRWWGGTPRDRQADRQ